MTGNAVTYARSSKDRSDVSIDAQHRALRDLAASRGYIIVKQYADAVESGKDDDRPGFQMMLRDLRAPDRAWNTVLVLDTARIARRRILALIFEEQECARRGVKVLYRSVPDADPMVEMLLKSILQAFDEWHSMLSRAKGLAGMAENVRQGWRAGGRAPRGYRLEHTSTGAIREGAPVMKSKLQPGPDAELVRQYLNARASGEPRSRATRRLGISWPQTTLLGIERQALTYAGHTVWNVHAERKGSGYGGVKRRPRAEWLTQRDTHPALISEDDAERLLDQLERRRSTRARADGRDYLLSGLLLTSDNRQWHGDGQRAYRLGKGTRIAISRIEPPVLDRIFADLVSPESIAAIERAVRAAQTPRRPEETAAAQRKLAQMSRQVSRLVDLAGSVPDGSPYLRRVAELEADRVALADELALVQTREQHRKSADALTTADIRRALAAFRDDLAQKRDDGLELEARAAISEFVERIEYEPGSESFKIRYRVSGVRLASPRGFEPRYSP